VSGHPFKGVQSVGAIQLICDYSNPNRFLSIETVKTKETGSDASVPPVVQL
jgi:hypothetical protein